MTKCKRREGRGKAYSLHCCQGFGPAIENANKKIMSSQDIGPADHDPELTRQEQGDTHELKHRVRDIPEQRLENAKQKWSDFGQGRPDPDHEQTREPTTLTS